MCVHTRSGTHFKVLHLALTLMFTPFPLQLLSAEIRDEDDDKADIYLSFALKPVGVHVMYSCI